MRAASIAEKAGVPTVSLLCDGFLGQGVAVSAGFGIPSLPVARIVGHVDGLEPAELERDIVSVTLPQIVAALTETPRSRSRADTFAPGQVVASGTADDISRIFEERQWSDGLPIVVPTPDRVAAFLAETSEDPNRPLGVMMPAGAAATVHNVAVNGVMAGCRPIDMPVLIAIAEAITDPGYGHEHSGDTTGGEALVVLSGPVIQRLGFNCEGAALRDGHRANTAVGRFVRLLLRNVARSLPGGADKSTFGNTFRVVLAEHEPALAALGWPTYGSDRGFAAGDSIVTVARMTAGGVVGSIYGRDPEVILRYIGDGLAGHSSWELVFTVGFARGTYRPLVVLSPLVARTLARGGLSKEQVREGLYRHARVSAARVEAIIGPWTNLVPGRPTLRQLVERGLAAPVFAESDDPARLVPVVEKPEDIQIVVAGDPQRSNAYVLVSNGMHGFPTSKRIRWREQQAQ